ncbi:MFS transporter [Nonomuraea sp. NPDC000554]|uniref:MFS transporter n=1 Tax=Nonomuraea sp. NPDC000554 TaxID=3154259 RepID=UPI0033238F75
MRYVRLLRHRRLCALWAAQTFSVVGNRLYMLAVVWLVWQTSHSTALLGLVALTGALPYVVVGVTGRRLLARLASLSALAVIDLARALAVIALPIWWAIAGPDLAGLFVVAGVNGLLGALFEPNLKALLPGFVQPDQVRQAVALLDSADRIARFAGPGAAALLLASLPATVLYVIDGATFIVSATALAWLGRRAAGSVAGAGVVPVATSPIRPLLRAHPDIAGAVAVHGVATLFTTVTIALPILVTVHLREGAGTYAGASACIGAGALLGNVLVGNLRSIGRFPGSYCGAWTAFGLMVASLGIAPSSTALLVLCVLLGITTPFMSVTLLTRLSAFRQPVRLRLMSLDVTVVRAGETVGMLLLPVLTAADVSAGFVLCGVLTSVVALGGWGLSMLRPARLAAPDLSDP